MLLLPVFICSVQGPLTTLFLPVVAVLADKEQLFKQLGLGEGLQGTAHASVRLAQAQQAAAHLQGPLGCFSCNQIQLLEQ
jgi:hypothetical protein